MTSAELSFFAPRPDALLIYEALSAAILGEFADVTVKVQATQITFRARYGFAFVSLRRIRGCPAVFLILSFGLARRLPSPRVAVATEPYPNRWTHHVIVTNAREIDGELLGWLREAHDFALTK